MNALLRTTALAAAAASLTAPAAAQTTTAKPLQAPQVVRMPTTFATSNRTDARLPVNSFGEYSAPSTGADRATVLDTVARERYQQAMEFHKKYGVGKRVILRQGKY